MTLGFSSVEDYEDTVQTFRFRRLREFWYRNKPEYTICFGGERWADFKLLFELSNTPSISFKSSSDVRYYETKGLFLMPFGRRGWRKGALPGAVADAVGDHIRAHLAQ